MYKELQARTDSMRRGGGNGGGGMQMMGAMGSIGNMSPGLSNHSGGGGGHMVCGLRGVHAVRGGMASHPSDANPRVRCWPKCCTKLSCLSACTSAWHLSSSSAAVVERNQSSVLPATVQVTTVHRTQVYNLGGLGGLAPELMNSSDGMFGASVMHGWCAIAF